jgi:histidine triad (HIT) family protein/ATP adenylyltransferase
MGVHDSYGQAGGLEERFERYRPDLDFYHRRARNGPCFVCAVVSGNPAFPDHPIVYEDERTIAFLTTNPTRYGYALALASNSIWTL